ncbi:ABC-2 family transporter protein [Lentzea fradiae]|uniref:ABC-2 family transporter protein n=1 Tax=Lentzea fradiae TaxID=200378 RepID=A0A1G7X671_9PSEU|nr:ABC transporter permease subunit [Lentzea fradiae]SDG79636.1 ABC-2 family transporter protein [Lentzea fradiae]
MIDRQRVWALMRKDWLEISRNKQAIAPLAIVPLLFAAIIPAAVILVGNGGLLRTSVNGLQSFLDNLPDGIVPSGYTVEQTVVHTVIIYFLAPFFLLIPVMVATIVGSSSFVGEKERRTVEGLLYTPLTNRELVLGKVLVSVVPSVLVTWVSFVVYTVVVNSLGASVMGGLFFPTWSWVVLVVVLVPLVSFLATSLIVAVSGRSKTMQGAQSTAVVIILPVVGLLIGQATGLMLFDITVALVAALVLLAIDVAAFFLVVKQFHRERVITSL